MSLNTALAVDYLIKFSINRLETTAKSRMSKNLLSTTKIALFAKIFANVPFIFVQIRHFSYLSNRYILEYRLITIRKIFENEGLRRAQTAICEGFSIVAISPQYGLSFVYLHGQLTFDAGKSLHAVHVRTDRVFWPADLRPLSVHDHPQADHHRRHQCSVEHRPSEFSVNTM